MKNKSNIIVSILSKIILILSSNSVLSQNVEEIDMFFAYEKLTSPISSYEQTGTDDNFVNMRGYCRRLHDHLKNEHGYNIQTYKKLTADMRFKNDETEEFIVDKITEAYGRENSHLPVVVCGPITVTSDRHGYLADSNGDFSEIYYVSRGKILIKKDIYENISYKRDNFYWKNDPLWNSQFSINAEIKIGYLGKTTSGFVSNYFRGLDSNYKKFESRQEIITALANDTINVLGSDEILIYGILNDPNLSEKKDSYEIIPKIGSFSTEPYAVIVYNNDDNNYHLLKKINDFIGSNEGKKSLNEAIKENTDLKFFEYIGTNSIIPFFGSDDHIFFIGAIWWVWVLLLMLLLLTLYLLYKFFLPREKPKVDAATVIKSEQCDIFISYSDKDSKNVQVIYEALKLHYPKTWISRIHSQPPVKIDDEIHSILQGCGCLVLLWSENAAKSSYVSGETKIAANLNKPIIPVLMDKDANKPIQLESNVWIDFTEFDIDEKLHERKEFQRLLKAVGIVLRDLRVLMGD